MGSVKPDQSMLLRADVVAKIIGSSKQTVYLLGREETLASVRWGRSVRFRRQDVEQFINSHRRGGEGTRT